MSIRQDAAGDSAQVPGTPKIPTTDWIVAGFAVTALGVVASRTAESLVAASGPLLALGAAIVLVAVIVAWRRPKRIVAFASSYRTTVWLLPRLVAFGVAIAVIGGALSSPVPVVRACPLDQDNEAVGELIHSRLAGDVLVCTYRDLSNRL